MIVVSSFDHAPAAFAQYQPSHVISILDRDEPLSSFKGLGASHHLRLIGDCSRNAACADDDDSRCAQLIAFAERWDRCAPLLIHCSEGVARSMAAAFIILCAVEKDTPESEIAARIRQAAPHADPNLLLVAEADKLLGRQDRMVEAILDLCPCAGSVAKPVVTLPVAA